MKLIYCLLILLVAAGCGAPLELQEADDLAAKIAAGVVDTSWAYVSTPGRVMKVRSIHGGWRVQERRKWTADNGQTLVVLVQYVADSARVDTICYEEKDCK